MSKIKEYTGRINDENKVAKYVKVNHSSWTNEFEYFHAVCIEDQGFTVVLLNAFNNLPEVEFRFSDFLAMIQKNNIRHLLFGLSTFSLNMQKETIRKFLNSFNPRIEGPMDQILMETNGWLLYNYQIEAIFKCVTGLDDEDANRFRRNFNKKKMKELSQYKTIDCFGENLLDVIFKRALLGVTYHPKYENLQVLFNHFTNTKN